MHPKILLVNQSSHLKTGYGVMGLEVLSRLSQEFEVAELACDLDPNIKYQPNWKVYPNLPTEQEKHVYNAARHNAFGRWKFDGIVQEFRPTHIISWRDDWMDSFIGRSPYKKYYNWIYMPTVDAEGLDKDWLYDYGLADKLFTYQQWSADQLLKESGGKLKASVCTPGTNIQCLDKKKLRASFGLNGPVIGTVMRNMGRKRFPELFQVVSKLVQTFPSLTLICHTAYPDKMGWDIPSLLLKNGIQNNVLFTYFCQSCSEIYPSLYKGKITFCKKCNHRSAVFSNGVNSLTDDQMSVLYNLMDLYVQFSSCEGLGIPLLEAATAGVPILAPKYSAMVDVIDKIGGEYIEVDALYREMDSDRSMCVPSIGDAVDKITYFLNLTPSVRNHIGINCRNNALSYSSWDKMADTLKQSILSLPCKNYNCQRDMMQSAPLTEQHLHMKNSDFIRWCILNVLGEPKKVNTIFEATYLDELESTVRILGNGELEPIDKQKIYKEFVNMRNYINQCEASL